MLSDNYMDYSVEVYFWKLRQILSSISVIAVLICFSTAAEGETLNSGRRCNIEEIFSEPVIDAPGAQGDVVVTNNTSGVVFEYVTTAVSRDRQGGQKIEPGEKFDIGGLPGSLIIFTDSAGNCFRTIAIRRGSHDVVDITDTAMQPEIP